MEHGDQLIHTRSHRNTSEMHQMHKVTSMSERNQQVHAEICRKLIVCAVDRMVGEDFGSETVSVTRLTLCKNNNQKSNNNDNTVGTSQCQNSDGSSGDFHLFQQVKPSMEIDCHT